MSIQFNFFALGDDELRVAGEVLSVFGEVYLMPERAKIEEMVPKRVQYPEDLISGAVSDKCCLFTTRNIESTVLVPVAKNLYCADVREFPALEYRPCKFSKETGISVGRFVYFYTGDHKFRWSVENLFRRLRQMSKALPNKRLYRVFPDAERSDLPFKGWV